MMQADCTDVVDEAELRHWKSHMLMEVLLEFAGSAMKPGDVLLAMGRLETAHTAMYEDLKRVDQKLAARRETASDQARTLPTLGSGGRSVEKRLHELRPPADT